jgi:hypothetical protein
LPFESHRAAGRIRGVEIGDFADASPADLTATCAVREAVKDGLRPTPRGVDGLPLGATLVRFWSAGIFCRLPAAVVATNAPFAAPSLVGAGWAAFVHLTPHPHDVSARGQMHYGEVDEQAKGLRRAKRRESKSGPSQAETEASGEEGERQNQ